LTKAQTPGEFIRALTQLREQENKAGDNAETGTLNPAGKEEFV
jgi:hypothetical protein